MASIQQEIFIDVPAMQAWDALRDVGSLHTRLVRGFVVDCRLEGDDRIVTFASGLVVREPIIDVSDARQRVAWSAIGSGLTHYNASAQVMDEGAGRCRVLWVADLLPNSLAERIAGMIAQSLA